MATGTPARLTRTYTTPHHARYKHPLTYRRTGIELSREDMGDPPLTGMCASMSEPHLPSTATGGQAESDDGSHSPFTSIPETFFRRRTGMTWLNSSRSGMSAASSRSRERSIPRDASFEVEHLGDIKTIDSGWLDDDIEEVMVVSKKEKKRRPLSVVVEATEARRSPLKRVGSTASVNANHFEYMGSVRTADPACESILARKFDGDDGRVYTVRFVRKSGQDAASMARFRNEQDALRLLTIRRVSYVTKLWWSFEDDKAMYLVTDRTDGRNLRSLIEDEGPIAGREALLAVAELAAGLLAIHEADVVHTNLNPGNVLIRHDGHIVISDFSQAQLPSNSTSRQTIAAGAVANSADITYHAPEKFLGWEYDCGVDWWSFGLVVYWVCTGQHPFVGERDLCDLSIVRSKILCAELYDETPATERYALELVARCLQRNPSLRIDGPGVKAHEYFQDINWDDISTQRTQAPFSLLDPDASPLGVDNSLKPIHSQDADQDIPPFSFDWQRELVLGDTVGSSRGHTRTTTRTPPVEQQDDEGDKTFMPIELSVAGNKGDVSAILTHDADMSILPDLVPTPYAGLPTPPNSRIGNLRKYSSLNFDELDELDSIRASESSGRLARSRSQSTALLRKSKSFLGLSSESLKDADADDASSVGSGRWTSKLRKRARPPTPVGAVPPVPPVPPTPPVPELPKGVEHIGSGIGYTYRADTRRQALNLASLTPRSCHGIFSGRRSKPDVGKRKAEDAPASQEGHEHELQVEGTAIGAIENLDEQENEQDIMDEVMREIYGEDWNAGLSPELGGRSAGLGWGDMMTLTRFGMAEDASFAGPDRTLRLVTSPSTPRFKLEP